MVDGVVGGAVGSLIDSLGDSLTIWPTAWLTANLAGKLNDSLADSLADRLADRLVSGLAPSISYARADQCTRFDVSPRGEVLGKRARNEVNETRTPARCPFRLPSVEVSFQTLSAYRLPAIRTLIFLCEAPHSFRNAATDNLRHQRGVSPAAIPSLMKFSKAHAPPVWDHDDTPIPPSGSLLWVRGRAIRPRNHRRRLETRPSRTNPTVARTPRTNPEPHRFPHPRTAHTCVQQRDLRTAIISRSPNITPVRPAQWPLF